MVKFGKNKFKALNKIAKKQKAVTSSPTNKVLKKKLNAEKKVSFQKEVLIKETVNSGNPLVKKVSAAELILNELSKQPANQKPTKKESIQDPAKPKQKPVEKHKKRQKTQINDTKLLLNLMKRK